jgi:hypothetical protein
MKHIFLLLILSITTGITSAQQVLIEGRVTDENNVPLAFTNIRVAGTMFGTSANKEGRYELKLKSGKYILIASYIGYISDTVKINAYGVSVIRNFSLKQTNIPLPEITVLPGENPAIPIIIKAIQRKKERDSLINSYEFKAYTKGIVKTQRDISASDNTIGVNLAESDTVPLRISGIIENQSEGFYRKPDDYKEIILARKQTVNLPPSINIVAGGRFIQNFYDETINFLGEYLPGPLADNALNYYYYYIENTAAINNTTVYKIHIVPDDEHDPGFTGSIYITDGRFDLIKVDLQLNRAANTGGIFDTVSVVQQFSAFTDSIVMPVDYRLYVEVNYLNLARVGIDFSTILYDYKLNPVIANNFFDKAVIKVIPKADERDSVYWNSIQTIPNTPGEERAYKRIDSLARIPKTFWDRFSILSSRIDVTDNFAVSAPLGMYHFNRVEGHTIDYGFFLEDALKKRLNGSLNFSYGFSDKRLKEDLSLLYLLGEYRTYSIGFKAYNRLNILFSESDEYGEFIPSILALISKYEFRDYYYSKGFNLNLSGEVFPVLALSAGFKNRTDKSAVNNSDFSFFNRSKSYSQNKAIYDTHINAVTAGFKLDFRDFIEDGYYRRRISGGESYIILDGEVELSDKKVLKSGLDYTTYRLNASGSINTFESEQLDYHLMGMFNRGSLDYQSLYALPGNIDILFQGFSFRTLNINEIFGSRIITINLEHNFQDLIFHALRIPGLMDWEIQLNVFFNAAYSDIGRESSAILPVQVNTFPHPFYETGFGLSHVLLPFRIEFAWRLNYRGENNFRVGINSVLF